MKDTGFDGIDEVLDSSFEKTEDSVADAKSLLSNYGDLADRKTTSSTIQDKEFMELELKTSINDMKNVLATLQEDIKIGSQPRMFEVYATLSKTVLDGIKELRDLNMDIENLKIKQEAMGLKKQIASNSQHGPATTNNLNVMLSGKDLFSMLNKAKVDSELNEIDAEFDVGDSSGNIY